MAQLPEITNVPWTVYAMVAAGLTIIYLFPLLARACRRYWWRSSCSRWWRWR